MEGGAAAAAVDWLGCKGKPAAPPGTRLRSVSPPPLPSSFYVRFLLCA